MAYVKDPSDKLDYAVDWTAWLSEGETIASTEWTVETGLTKMSSPAATDTANPAVVWLEGGDDGEDYTVACKITTNQSRVVERSFTVQVRDR